MNHSVRIITNPKEIEKIIISNCVIPSVKKEAQKCLNSGSSLLLEVYSKNFEYFQETGCALVYADVSKIMEEEFGASTGDYWFLTVTLPRAPQKPVVYIVLTQKNM